MPQILPATLISRSQDLLATEVDGETVLMHIEQGRYYGLAKTARAIWTLLETPLRFQELCGALQARYAGDPVAIAVDAERFVAQMADETLVTLS